MDNCNGEIKVFAGSGGNEFATKICQYLGVELGNSQAIKFSDGNTFVRILETVRDKDVYLVQSIGLDPNNEFVEILFWMDAFKRASANSVTAIMPYFGYAKGDKKDEPRVSIRARVCAESIELAGADRVVVMDLHAPQIQGFFKKPVDHLFALPVLCQKISQLDLYNPVIVAPDAGFAKQARIFSKHLRYSLAIADKNRSDHNENAEIMELIGDVKDKDAIIVDDFSASGKTIANLAVELRKRGARRIIACLSHLVLSPEGFKTIDESLIEKVIVTDSVVNGAACESKKIDVVSVAPLFAEAIYRIHNRLSVSPLFTSIPQSVIDSCNK